MIPVDLKPGMVLHFATAKDYKQWLIHADIDWAILRKGP